MCKGQLGSQGCVPSLSKNTKCNLIYLVWRSQLQEAHKGEESPADAGCLDVCGRQNQNQMLGQHVIPFVSSEFFFKFFYFILFYCPQPGRVDEVKLSKHQTVLRCLLTCTLLSLMEWKGWSRGGGWTTESCGSIGQRSPLSHFTHQPLASNVAHRFMSAAVTGSYKPTPSASTFRGVWPPVWNCWCLSSTFDDHLTDLTNRTDAVVGSGRMFSSHFIV